MKKTYTAEELRERKKEQNKKYREANKEKVKLIKEKFIERLGGIEEYRKYMRQCANNTYKNNAEFRERQTILRKKYYNKRKEEYEKLLKTIEENVLILN